MGSARQMSCGGTTTSERPHSEKMRAHFLLRRRRSLLLAAYCELAASRSVGRQQVGWTLPLSTRWKGMAPTLHLESTSDTLVGVYGGARPSALPSPLVDLRLISLSLLLTFRTRRIDGKAGRAPFGGVLRA